MKHNNNLSGNDADLMPKGSLRAYIVRHSILISFISFIVIFSLSAYVFETTIERESRRFANELSRRIYATFPLMMSSSGHRQQLLSFYNSYTPDHKDTHYSIRLYRTHLVEKLYGATASPPDSAVTKAFATRNIVEQSSRLDLDTIFPLAATDDCLRCHTNARSGDILGALRVRQDITPGVRDAGKKLFGYFLFLSPIPFLMAGFIARVANRRVVGAIDHLQEKLTDINSVNDLTNMQLSSIRPGFAEFQRVFDGIGTMAGRIRSVAIDKEMLEFQIQVLEKFIITSEVIKNWKEHVATLLLEINRLTDAFALLCIFQTDAETCEIEIFWRGCPADSDRILFEKVIRQRIAAKNTRMADCRRLLFNHTIADESSVLETLDAEAINVQTKSLVLKLPQIAAVVGIGLHPDKTGEGIRPLLVDSMLTTLLNVVGSVKAIFNYTQDLEYFATRDHLTNLYNQRAFWDLLNYEVNRSERHENVFTLLVIDLDNFKNINDSYGHPIGDRYLAEFARKVTTLLRKGDIFARYGGDEFTIVLPDADAEQAYYIAGRLRECIENLFILADDGSRVRGTASIGMAVYPTHARNAMDLFTFADNMTYKSKNAGKNRVMVPQEEDLIEEFRKAGAKARQVIEALENRSVAPFFQPIVPLSQGMPLCCEVLCRFSMNGQLSPGGDLIEVAENLGIMGKLDLCIMEMAFTAIKTEHYSGNIFVNLSPRSLISEGFIDNVTNLTDRIGIDRNLIVFELTERETVKNLAMLEEIVTDVKARGFKLAIDDFGSGFSSFHYIRHLQIDYVKIEGLFVQNILNDFRDMAFVKTLATLAGEFGITTIAEFIESGEILEAVRGLGINYAQGYYTGRPQPQLPKICSSAV